MNREKIIEAWTEVGRCEADEGEEIKRCDLN
jgi:hypothetical protein